MEIVKFIASKAVDAFVVAGVAWPYIPQARMILQTRNAAAFNLKASLILIVSAALRCFFWLCKPFETTLLIQAIVSLVAQLAMVYVVVHVKKDNAATATFRRKRTFADFEWNSFWDWDDFQSYLQFTAVFVVLLSALHGVFGHSPLYAELLGYLSLGIESTLPMPQALRNHQTKSTAGLSQVMIIAWLAGDAFKTLYGVVKDAPVQFILCGVVQVLVDIILFIQLYFLYPDVPKKARADRVEMTATAPERLDDVQSNTTEPSTTVITTSGDDNPLLRLSPSAETLSHRHTTPRTVTA